MSARVMNWATDQILHNASSAKSKLQNCKRIVPALLFICIAFVLQIGKPCDDAPIALS